MMDQVVEAMRGCDQRGDIRRAIVRAREFEQLRPNDRIEFILPWIAAHCDQTSVSPCRAVPNIRIIDWNAFDGPDTPDGERGAVNAPWRTRR